MPSLIFNHQIVSWRLTPVVAQGLGAENAHGHSEPHVPGEAPVASDSGISNVGIDNDSTNIPGTKGLKDVPVDTKEPQNNNMK